MDFNIFKNDLFQTKTRRGSNISLTFLNIFTLIEAHDCNTQIDIANLDSLIIISDFNTPI